MTIKQTLKYTVGALAIAGSVWGYKLIWGTPFNIDHFMTRTVVEGGLDSPQSLSSVRMLEPYGITGHNGKLDDNSVAHTNANMERVKRNRAILASYEDADLTADQKFNKAMLMYSMDQDISTERFNFHNYPINQLFGWHTGLPGFMSGTHAVTTVDEADYYIDRLHAVRGQFDQVMEQMLLREKNGIIPPKFALVKVKAQLDRFTADGAAKNALVQAFENKLKTADDISDADKARLTAEVTAVVEAEIFPIWAELTDYIVALTDKATTDDGIWKLPDGEAYYNALLEMYTTTKLTADEIHAIGLSEVDRLQGEMKATFTRMGKDVSGDFGELINEYAAEERHYYPDSDEGRAQILADYGSLIEEIDKGIADQFNLKPKAGVNVVRIPTFMEQGAPGGYYEQPAMDGSRPGQFYANLYDIKATPKYGMRALTYHEAIPGHHYQIALQQEQADLPLFRKFAFYGAYIEGWALYAERVALEMGFQKTDDDKIGAYQSELFRAVRLVVDTGIHSKRWTREQAIDYMASNTGMAMSDVVTEIERYIVLPGQACSYKIGQLTILRLRDKTREALGDKYDPRAFHDLVLSGGSLPLSMLETRVDDFISSVK